MLFVARPLNFRYIVTVSENQKVQDILIKKRASQRLFSQSLKEMGSFFQFPFAEDFSEEAKLVWLVRLRWVALTLFFFLAGPAYIVKSLNSTTLIIYLGILSFLFLFNLFTYLLFVEPQRSIGSVFVGFQLTIDLMALACLLLISGGFGNPFVALFLVNAAIGGVLIRGSLSWPFITLCHALLLALQIQYVPHHIRHDGQDVLIQVVASHVMVFSAWLVMRSLGAYLEKHFSTLTQSRLLLEKQDRLRAIGALAAGFSHEFASPLNAAQLRLDRLERELQKISVPSNILENLSKAQSSIQNCETVIRQMNSSQLDVREYQLKKINMNEFLLEIVSSWQAEYPQAHLTIRNTLEQPLWISPINLAQVILNLLDNAFEANPAGNIQLDVRLENAWVVLTVEDQGPGFQELVLKRQGEPFITTKDQGTGLGLYVSEIFVQSMGGKLTLQNKKHESGAIVKMSWPLNYGEGTLS